MQELIDDLRSALDQMNRSLKEISEQNQRQTKLLEQIAQKAGVRIVDNDE